jgi:FkbM family methyltransferase
MNQELSNLIMVNRAAERRLIESLANSAPGMSAIGVLHTAGAMGQVGNDLTVVLAHNELNAAHGTGILAHRLLRDVFRVAVIRTYTHYDGTSLLDGPNLVLPESARTRKAFYSIAVDWFLPGQVTRVVCIPFGEQELELAIALKRVHNVQLCLYIMDDNCLFTDHVPRGLMAEAIEAADLCLAISPEMQNAYQDAFRKKFWILPPLLEPSLLLDEKDLEGADAREPRGVVVGNIWSQAALDLFCSAMKGAGIEVDWYCNTQSPWWLNIDLERLKAVGITFHAPLPEPELVEVLRHRAFAILPSGTLDDRDANSNLGRLSLPSRVPFIAACAATPIIVLGNSKTSAGAFVEHFAVGTTADYNRRSLHAAVAKVSEPGFGKRLRNNIARIGRTFSSEGMAEWVFEGAAKGRPPDMRFEELLSYRRHEFGHYVPIPAPQHVFFNFRPDYESLDRLHLQGFKPDFVVDIGASTGVWSYTMSEIFRDARYILVDPLMSRYPKAAVQHHVSHIKCCETLEVAVSDREGDMEIEVSDNLYGSSLIGVGSSAIVSDRIRVPVATLDGIAKMKALKGRGLVKIDVQFAEHLVIEGGATFIRDAVDCLVVELTIERAFADARTATEVIARLDELGFQWVDLASEWRSLANGRLEQFDAVFVRKNSSSVVELPNRAGI